MPQLRRQWTVADLEGLPDDGNRYEVIDGELFMTPAPSFAHQRAIGAIYELLHGYLSAERTIGDVIFAPADVAFSPTRSLQPDLFVIPLLDGRSAARFADVGRLLLAVEVLSPRTARSDRVVKRRVFREERVPEYWIVDLDSRTIERSTDADAHVEVLAERITWLPDHASRPFELEIAEYFAAVVDG